MVIFGQLHFNPVQQNLQIILWRKIDILYGLVIEVMTVFSLQGSVEDSGCVCEDNQIRILGHYDMI